jgi:hypothetical protein
MRVKNKEVSYDSERDWMKQNGDVHFRVNCWAEAERRPDMPFVVLCRRLWDSSRPKSGGLSAGNGGERSE